MVGPVKKSIADYEWASLGRYVMWLEVQLGLNIINSDHVNSFSISRDGTDRLIAKKVRTEARIRENMDQLEKFIRSHGDELGVHELSVIRSFYRTLRMNAETCREHADVARTYAKSVLTLFDVEEETNDSLPF